VLSLPFFICAFVSTKKKSIFNKGKKMSSFDQNEIANEKMKIKLEKNIRFDGLNDIEKVQMDEYLTKEAEKRIAARDVQNAMLDAVNGRG
jgi:hypothetical protein